jgi:hypothetical protein
MTRLPLRLTGVVAAAGLLFAACGGGRDASSAAANGTVATSTTAAAAATADDTATSTTTSSVTSKVSANDASIAELTAAFETAGISNAARWAREVDEYRPYPTTDPTFAKLRQELAKYHPADGVIDAIIDTLEL